MIFLLAALHIFIIIMIQCGCCLFKMCLDLGFEVLNLIWQIKAFSAFFNVNFLLSAFVLWYFLVRFENRIFIYSLIIFIHRLKMSRVLIIKNVSSVLKKWNKRIIVIRSSSIVKRSILIISSPTKSIYSFCEIFICSNVTIADSERIGLDYSLTIKYFILRILLLIKIKTCGFLFLLLL